MSLLQKLRRVLRYDWPLHGVLLLTAWLPDNVIMLRLRGRMAAPFLGKCGGNLTLARGIVFYNPQNIEIGRDVFLAYGVVLIAIDKIRIGDEVLVGPYAVLAAGNHTKAGGSYRHGAITPGPIDIGFGSWLGAHVSVVSGAVVGKGCVIGSNACVVRGTLADHSFAAGVPAKVIRSASSGEQA